MPTHTDRTHAKHFSPSKADAWVSCTAQPVLVEVLQVKDRSTAAADEGTAAHEMLELSLTTGKPPTKFVGRKASNGVTMNEEMAHHIRSVVAWINAKVAEGYQLKAERKLMIAVTGDTGTTDVTLWHRKRRHLIVGDLKYGKGYEVDPAKNRQMRLYACGTCDADGLWDIMVELTLVIFQPRICEEPLEWEDSPKGLRHFREVVSERVAEITAALKLAKKLKLSPASSVEDFEATGVCFKPSEKACKWCPGRHGGCKAYAAQAAKEAGLDFAEVTAEKPKLPSAVLSDEEMVRIWKNAGMFTDWLKTISETLFLRLLEGQKIEGMKLVEGKSNRAWINEGDTMEMLSRLGFKADQFAPRSLAGLGAIERLFGDKRQRVAFMAKHTHKPKGKASLASSDDDRPAYTRDDFAEVEL
jgi:hypothetical protein